MHQHLPAARTTMKPRPLLLAVCVWLSALSVNAESANFGPAMYKICCSGFYINSHSNPADSSRLDLAPSITTVMGEQQIPSPARRALLGCNKFLVPICQACPSCPSGMWLGLWWVVSWHLYQVQCMPQGKFACSALADTKCTGISCTTQNTFVCEVLFCLGK